MGTVALLVILCLCAVMPSRIARFGWFPEWQESTWGIGVLLGVCLLPWYAVFLLVGGADWLVPFAMAMFAAVFGFALWQRTQTFRRRR